MRRRALTGVLVAALSALTACRLLVPTIDPGVVVEPTAHDHFTRIDGVNYHYLRYPGPGPTVLMIHGFASSTYTWEQVAPPLNRLGYNIIALDLKGFGWSDKPRGAAYDAASLERELLRFIDQLGLQHYALVGHSLGGAIALLTALDRPQQIERLILVDPAAPRTEHRPGVFQLLGTAPGAWTAEVAFGQWMVDWNLDEVYFDRTRISPQTRRAYYDRLRSDGALAAQTAIVSAVNAPGLRTLFERVPTIQLPTLILWGEQDRWVPLAVGQALQREIAGSQLVVLPRCGHLPQEEWPDQTTALFADFLAR